MKCDPITKRYTIKVPADNSFRLILPLKTRTYVSNVPIDAPIVYAELEDVVLTIGGTEYDVTLGLQGVEVYVADGLAKGVYDIILTATYHDALIRAAYFETLEAVEWQYLSDFQQYLVGSPIVADAAIVIGGPLTDEQLEQLKEQYREATADANEREAEAQAKVEEYAERIEHLDNLATEQNATLNKQAILNAMSTDTGLIRGDVADAKQAIRGDLSSDTTAIRGDIAAVANAIAHIDFSALATKAGQEAAAAQLALILQRIGAPDDPASANTLFGAILNIASQIDFTTVIQKLDAMWGANSQATLTAILAAVNAIDTSDPYSQALAAFFNITPPVPNAVPMTQQEVEDDLDELWNLIITQ